MSVSVIAKNCKKVSFFFSLLYSKHDIVFHEFIDDCLGCKTFYDYVEGFRVWFVWSIPLFNSFNLKLEFKIMM